MTSLPRNPEREEARPRHRSRHLRRLSCLRGQLQGMEQRRPHGAADRSRSLRRQAVGRLVQPRAHLRGRRRRRRAAPCISRAPACIASSRPASRSARPAPPTSAPRTASCWSTRMSVHRLQAVLLGLPLRRARIRLRCRRDEEMHALHRPDLQREPRGDRPRAGLRLDLPRAARAISAISAIPSSDVSKLVAERGGYDLMPELGYEPVNKYLPPRPRQTARRLHRRQGAAGRAGERRHANPSCGGSTASCRARAAPLGPCIRRFRSSSSPSSPARVTACCFCWASVRRRAGSPPDRWFGAAAFGLVARRDHLRAALLDASSRPSRAGLARVLAVAVVLAVARGRRQPDHLPAGRHLRPRLVCRRQQRAAPRLLRRDQPPSGRRSRSIAPA